MKAGDAVRFDAIDRAEFDRLRARRWRARAEMAALRVIKPGMLTTVQDRGRWGFQSRGVPVAGPMDPCSHRLANALVGNASDAATLEVTLLGPELEFDDERRGRGRAARDFELTVNSYEAPCDRGVRRARRGAAAFRPARAWRARLSRRRRRHRRAAGARQPRHASRRARWAGSTGARCGRATGCRSAMRAANPRPQPARRPSRSCRCPTGHARFACSPGPQADYFAADALDVAAVGAVHDRPKSDRMGFRLDGPPLTHARGADIISDATPLGVAAGAGVRAADPADGRSPDRRRLSEDRDGHHRRHRPRRTARAWRRDRVRRLLASGRRWPRSSRRSGALMAVEAASRG